VLDRFIWEYLDVKLWALGSLSDATILATIAHVRFTAWVCRCEGSLILPLAGCEVV
jgi:hypothetical protein